MTLAEIMQKITELSPEDRTVLRRELEQALPKLEAQAVTSETAQALQAEQSTAGDERSLPVEDVIEPPKPKD